MKAQQSAAASRAVLGEASLSGRQAKNVRPALKVAYATTNIIVFCKRFYKNPSGVKSATQNLHNKGKPAGRDPGKHSTQTWRRGFQGGVWLSAHELLCSIWSPEAGGESMGAKG